jgi:hypothetical protein
MRTSTSCPGEYAAVVAIPKPWAETSSKHASPAVPPPRTWSEHDTGPRVSLRLSPAGCVTAVGYPRSTRRVNAAWQTGHFRDSFNCWISNGDSHSHPFGQEPKLMLVDTKVPLQCVEFEEVEYGCWSKRVPPAESALSSVVRQGVTVRTPCRQNAEDCFGPNGYLASSHRCRRNPLPLVAVWKFGAVISHKTCVYRGRECTS